MRAGRELADPYSCFNKAKEHELIFVLLGRDSAAPFAIYCWCVYRWLSAKNDWNDAQIQEALSIARDMKYERRTGVYN